MTAIELFKLRSKEVWNKIYALINWKNRPSTATALGATNLNKMDVAINTLDNRVIQLQAGKLGIDVANLMVSSWVMDMKTYKITVTQLNGTVKEYDLNLERIPLKTELSPEGILKFTYADGTSDSVNIADLIKDTVYDASDTITFEKKFEGNAYHVTASIKNGSIEERHLNIPLIQDIRDNANVAQTAANSSLTYSMDSKRWAVGDSSYEGSEIDNSKYYKEQSEAAKIAAEKARDEAQAATGNVIMAPGTLGVGKPDNQTIGAEADGTIKLIAKAAALPVTDSNGLVGELNAETNMQLLVNAITEKIMHQLVTNDTLTSKLADYISKAMMSNVQVDDQDKVPTSALAYAMQQSITNNETTITQLNRDIVSGYLGLTVKKTHLTLFVQELEFINGVAKLEASKYLGYTPTWLGAVCQPNKWSDGSTAILSIAYSDNVISVYILNKPEFNGKSWLTAMIISTKE